MDGGAAHHLAHRCQSCGSGRSRLAHFRARHTVNRAPFLRPLASCCSIPRSTSASARVQHTAGRDGPKTGSAYSSVLSKQLVVGQVRCEMNASWHASILLQLPTTPYETLAHASDPN